MIVAVCGGKGGVGKTTLTLNLGRELDAVVVDADLTTPDLPRGRGPDLHDVLAGRAGAMAAVEEFHSVHVLPCGRTLAGARASDLENLEEAVTSLDRQFEYVLVDCPAGLARDVGYQLSSADVAVLVTKPEKPALLNAFRTCKLARKVDTPVACIVLNMVTDESDHAVADRVEDRIGAPTLTVPKHDAIADSQEWGEPVRDVHPGSDAIDPFESVADTIEECDVAVTDRLDAA